MLSVIGFIGSDFYDAVLLLAMTLRNLSKTVLVIDYSDERKLVKCFPAPFDENPEDDVLHYNGIEYTSTELEKDELTYDHVLVYCGFSQCKLKCDRWVIVSNQEYYFQKSIIDYLKQFTLNGETILVLDDIVNSKFNNLFYDKISSVHPITTFIEIEMDYNIWDNRIKAQRGNFNFKKTPSSLKTLIFLLTSEVKSKKELRIAFKRAKGGKLIDSTILEYAPRTEP